MIGKPRDNERMIKYIDGISKIPSPYSKYDSELFEKLEEGFCKDNSMVGKANAYSELLKMVKIPIVLLLHLLIPI